MKSRVALLIVVCLAAVGLFAADAKKETAKADYVGNIAKGKETFDSMCVACHQVANEEKTVGPSLKGLYKKDKLQNGKKVTDASVMEVINKGGMVMPPYEKLITKAEDKADLMAYLRTL